MVINDASGTISLIYPGENMNPPNIHELEAALLVEMYICGIFAVLIPLGLGQVAGVMSTNARLLWSHWKEENDRKRSRIDFILHEYNQIYASGPNRLRNMKRKLLKARDGLESVKRVRTGFNHGRALMAVREDWFADVAGIPRPKFSDIDFEQTFAVTRSHMEEILIPACTRHRPDIFCVKVDAVKNASIAPIVKILNALKIARFGVSVVAFKDYFQMGETTARFAFHAFMDAMANDEAVSQKYRRSMTRNDLARVMRMHHEQHGVNGLAFSIDCWHLHWKNCPVAWKGQLDGKEDKATLVMEAGIDYNLWFWHAVFGFPGTMNDIQIWEQSDLYRRIATGEWARFVDPVHPFVVGSLTTTKVFFPVDGIYPLLSRFVKTISVPTTPAQSKYAAWQEAVRKDSERGFGVLGTKFRILIRPVEFHQPRDIVNMVNACIAMHNMMIEHRMFMEEEDRADMYSIGEKLNEQIHARTKVWIQQPIVEPSAAVADADNQIDSQEMDAVLRADQGNPMDQVFDPRERAVRGPIGAQLVAGLHSNYVAETDLECPHKHFELQEAIVEELTK